MTIFALIRNGLLCLFCLIILFTNVIFAVGDDWRPISPQELAMKTPQVEPDADAEIIFEEIRIDDSSSEDLSMKHYLRVKIFTERGREKFSKFDIPFIKGKKIKDIAARVIKADGSIVEINDKDIFEREIIKTNGIKIKAKSFAIPNIEPGVIVEYRYKEVLEDSGASGMHLTFQRDLPAQTLSYYYKPYNGKEPNYQSFNFSDTKFVKDEKGYYLAKRNNVPASKSEPQMPPDDEVRPWILIQNIRLNFTSGGGDTINFSIKDPSNPDLYWGAVRADYLGLVSLMTKSDDNIKKTAAEITASASTQEEKLQKLYEFCQKQIKNTSFDTTAIDPKEKKKNEIKSLGDVLKYKMASSPFIDLLFGAMANSLGYGTRIAFAANRDEKFFNSNMTNEKFIHPAAIAVKVGEEWRFFNPSTPYLPIGSLVWYEEGVYALLIDDKGYTWRKTPLSDYDKSNAKRTGKFKLLEDGSLEGDVKIEYYGQRAITRRAEGFDDTPTKREDDLKAEIKAQISTAEVSELKIENFEDNSKPLIQTYKLKIANFAQKTGKRLFLQPSIFEYGAKPMFSSAARTHPIYFSYPWAEEDNITIELPKGFSLDNAESPGNVSDPANIGALDINIGVDKEQTMLVYSRKFHFGGKGNILFPVEAYQPIKSLFDAFQKSDAHTITLKQK